MPYLLEKDLLYHVQNYTKLNKPPVDFDTLTEHLIATVPHYGRKKRKPFKESVIKAYGVVVQRSTRTQNEVRPIPDVPTDRAPDSNTMNTPKQTPQIQKYPATNQKSAVDAAIELNLQNHLLLDDFESTIDKIPLDKMKGIDSLKLNLNQISFPVINRQKRVFILLSGPKGSGKSTLLYSFARWLKLAVVRIDCSKLFQGDQVTSTPDKRLKKELIRSEAKPGSILHIDKIDRLFTKDINSNSNKDIMGILSSYLACLERRSIDSGPLVVIGEVIHPELMDSELSEKFERRLIIPPPDWKQRFQILQTLVEGKIATDVCLRTEARAAVSYVAHDLCRLVKTAEMEAENRMLYENFGSSLLKIEQPIVFDRPFNCLITSEDFRKARKVTTPGLKNKGFPSVPDTTWADIGGLTETRETLRNLILDPILNPEMFRLGGAATAGILLWGPPGCGKTLLAKAVANEAGINLLIVNGPSLLNMYQGESEREVRAVFAKAASVAPCVIFFDEFDSLCPQRSGAASQSGSKSTIVNTLLTEMDGFLSRPGIYIMAATNLPSILDPAVLRPGRLDSHLYVGHPDVQGRLAVFRAVTKNGRPKLATDVNLSELAKRTECEGFSGADCANLINRSVVEVWKERKTYLKSSKKRPLVDQFPLDQPDKCARTELENNRLPIEPTENGREYSKQLENGEENIEELDNSGEYSKEIILSPEEKLRLFPDGLDCIYKRHLELALSDLKPSISQKELKKYQEYRASFGK